MRPEGFRKALGAWNSLVGQPNPCMIVSIAGGGRQREAIWEIPVQRSIGMTTTRALGVVLVMVGLLAGQSLAGLKIEAAQAAFRTDSPFKRAKRLEVSTTPRMCRNRSGETRDLTHAGNAAGTPSRISVFFFLLVGLNTGLSNNRHLYIRNSNTVHPSKALSS